MNEIMVFHSDKCLNHDPQEEFMGSTMRPYPERPERVTNIISALKKEDIGHYTPNTYDRKWVEYIHDIGYIDFVDQMATTFPADRQTIAPTAFNYGGSLSNDSTFYAKIGHYFFDPATPLVPQTGEAAFAAVDCVLNMADTLLDGDILSGALSRPPGHHAMYDKGGGYCIFNNAAITANYLTTKGKSVSILDLDYHHGNGTQQIFYDRDDVQYVSIHADTRSNYPFYWGFPDQKGEDAGEGHTHNLPVPNTIDPPKYMDRVDHAINIVNDYNPHIVLVSMGFDCYFEDPIAGLTLTKESYSSIGKKLQQFERLGIILEGGYDTSAIGDCFANLYTAIIG